MLSELLRSPLLSIRTASPRGSSSFNCLRDALSGVFFILLAFSLFLSLSSCSKTNGDASSAKTAVAIAPTQTAKLKPKQLTVAFCLDPASWFVNGAGDFTGFEYDLLSAFSEQNKMSLAERPALNNEDLRRKLESLQANISTGLYHLTLSGSQPRSAKILWTKPYFSPEILLVYNRNNRRPKSWADVKLPIVYMKDSGMDSVVYRLSQRYPYLRWMPIAAQSADAILDQLNKGQYAFALVAAHQAVLASNIYLNVDTAFPTGAKLDMVWAVPAKQRKLRDALNRFIDEAQNDGLIEELADRYFLHPREVNRFDAAVFHERIQTELPAYKALFYDAEQQTGIEWRLLAALSYQESQWDTEATSDTGVRGIMQITMRTARLIGLDDRLNAEKSIIAGANYLRSLKDRFPPDVVEPDRTWLALAAYNIGYGHVEDARQLARESGLDPNLWRDVRKMLPLLTQPEYYAKLKYGYARGGMPVVYVGRIRAYYDILLHDDPDNLSLQLLANSQSPLTVSH